MVFDPTTGKPPRTCKKPFPPFDPSWLFSWAIEKCCRTRTPSGKMRKIFPVSSVWQEEVALLCCLAVFRPIRGCNRREYFRVIVFRTFRRVRNVPGFHLIRRRRFQHGHDLFRLRKIRIQPVFFQFPRQLHRLAVVVRTDNGIRHCGDDGKCQNLCVGCGIRPRVVQAC